MRLNEYVGLWGRYSLKQGNPLYFFQSTNPIIFVTFFFILWLVVSKKVSKIIIWIFNEKVLAYEAATAWNRGIPCNFSKHQWNLYDLCTNYFTYCIIKGIKVKNFWGWIKKCRPLIQIFLHESGKKTLWGVYFYR